MIWLVTMAGVLPVGFLSIACVRSHALSARIRGQPSEPGSVSITASSTVEIGPSLTKIAVSTEIWPAVVTACGIVFVLVGMFFLLPKKPQQLYHNGLSRMGYYVERVFGSQHDYASVIITKPDHAHSVLVARRGGRVLLSVVSNVSRGDTADLPAKIESFFASRGIMPDGESLSDNTGMKHTTCCLQFSLSRDSRANTELIRALFTDLFGVSDSTGLEFTTTGF